MDQLGKDLQLKILRELDLSSVLSLGACNKDWQQLLASEDALWQHLCGRDQPMLRRQHAYKRAMGARWREAYQSAHRMQGMQRVVWEHQDRTAGWTPRSREGHAACSWGHHSMLLSGGFGGGTLSDLHLLTPAPSTGTSSGYRWVQPRVSGRFPIYRYGHTLTRCGIDGELAVLFGGLLAGGYQVPVDTIAVLRRRPRAATSDSTASVAAEAEAAAQWGAKGCERDTSLSLRLAAAGGQGAQMMMEGLADEEAWDVSDGDDDDNDVDGGDDNLHWEEIEEEEATFEESEEEEAGELGGMVADAEMVLDGAEEEHEEEGAGDADDGDWVPPAAPAHPLQVRTAAITAVIMAAPPAAADDEAPPHPDTEEGNEPNAATVASEAGASSIGPPAHDAAACGSSHATQSAPATSRAVQEDVNTVDEEYEWWYPRLSGEAPGCRGYHSAAVSEDGRQIWFFGGITERGACNLLAVLDVTTWQFSRPVTSGQPPPPRLGHSSCIYGGRLWVVGGGTGRDLLRTGRDLDDVYCLDLETLEWRRVDVSGDIPPCAGKCHTSVLVGNRLLLFGGSMETCNDLAWLDLDTTAWGRPGVMLGEPPCERMSATAVMAAGGQVLVFGGYTLHFREVGDLYRLKLLPTEEEMDALGGGAAAVGRSSRAGWSGARRGWTVIWR